MTNLMSFLKSRTMGTSEERNAQSANQGEDQGLVPSLLTAEELNEARRKKDLKYLFDSSKILLTVERPPRRADLNGSLIIQNKAREHYTNGKEAMEKSQYERAVICFSKAITLQPEQTELHVSQAEAYLQLCDFQSAAACYRQAASLQPGAFSDRLTFIYYLQGQCLFDQGLFLDALETFNKAAEMKPGYTTIKAKILACLAAAGHHADCLKKVNDWMASDGPTSDLHIFRAKLHRLMNQTPKSYQDVKMALALNPTCPVARALLLQLQEASEMARQKAVDKAASGHLLEALCLINVALDNCPKDARLYLFRGILYRLLKDFAASIEDLIQAAELSEEEEKEKEEEEVRGRVEDSDDRKKHDSVSAKVQFQLVLTFNDFAIQCFNKGLYAEATLLLNKAIEEEKGQAGLYLTRGDCFFKQREWAFAMADYQQAEEMMRPDDPALRLRLAVLHNTLGSLCFQDGLFQEAADRFSLAIKYNPTASLYYKNRSNSLRKLSDIKRAREDFICMMILDPSCDESPVILFPGWSVSDVLSSAVGRAVRARLMETIQVYDSSSDQQRLSEELQKMSLANENTASQSQEPSDPGNEGTEGATSKELKRN